MRKVIYLILFLCLIVTMSVGALLVIVTPFYLYEETLINGISNQYITLLRPTKYLLAPKSISLDISKGKYTDDGSLWKNFHFLRFNISLPLHHPQILVIPDIDDKFEYKSIKLGAKFLDHNQKQFYSFRTEEVEKFSLLIEKQKIFNLPIFKNKFLKMSSNEIWRDIFNRNIKNYKYRPLLSSVINFQDDVVNNGLIVVAALKTMNFNAYFELVYNLFILNLRENLFNKNVLKISFLKDKNYGVIQLKDKDERFIKEKVLILEGGVVYEISLRTKQGDILASSIRKKMLENLDYRPLDKNSAELIYNEYKQLNYDQKVDQEGMTYLYAAWSHVHTEKEFLREMIQFLEKGRNNSIHLAPLYQFGYKKFGTTFSSKSDKLKEDASAKLERKIAEELAEEIEKEKKLRDNISDSSFDNSEQKVKYYLNKAKNADNTDVSDEVLEE